MPAPTCINLKERFGRQHRVTYDRGAGARAEAPHLMILLCRFGHIYPWSGTLLAVSVDGFPKIAARIRALPCCTVHQDGDFGELTALFDVNDFAAVAQVMRPRRRRQVTPEQRAEMVRRLHPDRQSPPQTPVYGQFTARGGDLEGQDGQTPLPGQRALF